MLFDFFFETIHPRWPLLDRVRYETVFEKQNTPEVLSTTEWSILHLIYAITARFLAVTRKPCGVDDDVRPEDETFSVVLTDGRLTLLPQRNLWSRYYNSMILTQCNI